MIRSSIKLVKLILKKELPILQLNSSNLQFPKCAGSEASVDLARAYFSQRNYKVAAEEFRKVPRGMLSADDCYKMGICEEKNGNPMSAVEFFEIAAEKFGASTATNALLSREKLGRAKLKSESFSSALEQFQFIINADQKALTVPDIYLLLSEAQSGAGQKNNAISTLEKAIKLNEKNIEAYARLADLYQESG
jgi:tetratricopeptide (TPR) repeat protein